MNEFDHKETDLYNRWLESYPKEQRDQFCFDGLIYYRNPDCKEEYAEVVKWEHAKRKIVFLLKDTNANPDCDYREWEFYDTESQRLHKCFVVLMKWLWSLNEVTATHFPELNTSREENIERAMNYPMAIVNVKKIAGGSYVSNTAVREYYERDKAFLKEQLRDILKPTIIVCGGGSGILLSIAKDIYNDMAFVKYNDWCYFCGKNNLLIIDSYHPSYRCSDELKFNRMIENVQDMLKKIPL